MCDEHRELLSRIAAFRSPMDYEALETVATLKAAKLDAALDELEARGLLLRDPDGKRYDLHPIVRRYAYDRLADKAGVHVRLREYFEAPPGTGAGRDPGRPGPHDRALLAHRRRRSARLRRATCCTPG